MTDYRAAKDIPDAVFLAAVVIAAMLRGSKYASRWDVEAVLGGHPVPRDFAAGDIPGVPEKVVLAKARRLIETRAVKLIDGCCCGCRGDFQLTAAGRAVLHCNDSPARSQRIVRESIRLVRIAK